MQSASIRNTKKKLNIQKYLLNLHVTRNLQIYTLYWNAVFKSETNADLHALTARLFHSRKLGVNNNVYP